VKFIDTNTNENLKKNKSGKRLKIIENRQREVEMKALESM
jgi:hypothetical protein